MPNGMMEAVSAVPSLSGRSPHMLAGGEGYVEA
jgi:hypothetical protein